MGVLLTVNGQERQIATALTLRSLLDELGLEPAKIAVERNLEIVPRSQYDAVVLRDGDRLEIVQFIGGG